MPLGAYRLNSLAKAAVVADTTRTAIALTANGNAKLDEGAAQSNKFGQSVAKFDGSGDYITGDNFAIPATGEFTLEYYYKSNSSSSTRTMFAQYYGGSANEFTIWQSGSDYVNMYYQGAGGHILTSTTAIADGTWHHIAITRNSSNRFDLWINGTSEDNHTTSGSLLEQNIMIGARLDGGGPSTTEYVNGYIDEMRVSTVCRYTTSFTPHTTAHVNDSDTSFLMHADGFSGDTTFLDDVGSRHYFSPNVRFGGEYDTAQYKYGTSSWYQSSNFLGFKMTDEDPLNSIGSGDYTLEAWVRKDTDITGLMYIWFANNQMSLRYDDSNNTLEYCADNAETTRITGGALNNNTWYHVAVSRSSGTTKMFIDGTQTGSNYTDDRSFANVTEHLFFVDSNGLNSWRGHVDEMRLSSTARYTSNFTAPSAAFENDSDTVFLYHFEASDASTGSIVDDNA